MLRKTSNLKRSVVTFGSRREPPEFFPECKYSGIWRTFTADEEVPGKDQLVILGLRFGGSVPLDPIVHCGRTLRLDGESYVLSAIMQRDVWLFWRENRRWTPACPFPGRCNLGRKT